MKSFQKNSDFESLKFKANHGVEMVDYVGQFVELKPYGKTHRGLCPFHQEKTPSFVVYHDQNRFCCFGCHEKGDLINFVMKYHKIDFIPAVEKLTGVQIEDKKMKKAKEIEMQDSPLTKLEAIKMCHERDRKIIEIGLMA